LSLDIFIGMEFSALISHEKEFLAQSHQVSEQINVDNESIFLYVQKGMVTATFNGLSFTLCAGMFASLARGSRIIFSKDTKAISVSTEYSLINQIGGPVESTGRLQYIDGCSDTLLISPLKLGMPCLNFLHFPPDTKQSSHFHPSFRFGIVTEGEGVCITTKGQFPLIPGSVFFIPENVNHHFNTFHSHLNVIAFHPDSDWGPTDERHPMINRTHFTRIR
jgi:quercetin dioxygenase-like cupin family protein